MQTGFWKTGTEISLGFAEVWVPSVLKIPTVKPWPCPLTCRSCSAVAFHDLPLASWKEGSSVGHFALFPVQHTRALAHLWRYKRTLGFARTASDSKVFVFIKKDLPAISKTEVMQVTATAFEEFFWRSTSDALFIWKYHLPVFFNWQQNLQNVTQVAFYLKEEVFKGAKSVFQLYFMV